MILAIIQFALSFGVYKQDALVAGFDAFVSNLVFALLGSGLWYMVRFSGKQIRGILRNLAYHFAGCAITVLIWQVTTYAIITSIFAENHSYIEFTRNSLIPRVLTGILIYFLIISIDFLLLSFEEMNERAEHEASLAAMLRDAELNTLRSQIRPHFLFNSLNSISSLTLSNPQAAQDMIIKLSEFMRHSLTLATDTMNSLNEEMYHAGLYLDIEKVRFSDRLIVVKNLSEGCSQLMLPSMILQPLLENAVKHGINTMLTACTIKINAECNESYLIISISNNFDPDAVPRKGTGTGLSNVQKRMAALYGRTDLLQVKSDNSVFGIILRVPVQPNN